MEALLYLNQKHSHYEKTVTNMTHFHIKSNLEKLEIYLVAFIK